jgi:haloalkane dehalogenase
MSTKEISAAFPFESRFVDVLGSRMHYVEEGSGDPILFLHGQPTSSYLWRNVIPHLTTKGRCIAPDLIGFGMSDKPDIEYRFLDHARYVAGFIEALDLRNITLVIHDWGAGLGLYYARHSPSNIKAIALMEPVLGPVPTWDDFPEELTETFRLFRSPETGWDALVNQNMFVEGVLPGAIMRTLTEEEMDVYRKPFLDPAHRKPVYRWPNELPIAGEPADTAAEVGANFEWLMQSDLPKLLFHAAPGAIIRPENLEMVTSALRNLTTVDLGQGIHYLQEDHPHEIGEGIARWYEAL